MLNVLIVDDEKSTLDLIKRLGDWDKWSMQIVGEAKDGEEGKQLLASLHPDILITDMNMPGVDGVSLLKKVMEEHQHVKTIVLSGYDEFTYMKQAIRSKVVEYLLKPVNAEELNLALNKCANEILTEKGRGVDYAYLINVSLLPALNEFKSTINSLISEQNEAELPNAVDGLLRSINTLAANEQQSIAFKLYHELMLLVEEQLYKYHIIDTEFIETVKLVYTEKKSVAQLVRQFASIYQLLIAYLVTENKAKTKINLEKIKTYIDRNYADPQISLSQLAAMFYVSKEYLSKAFKKQFGQNVTEYIIECRMQEAKRLLSTEAFKIKSISDMVGYEDVSYFYRVFKKRFGIPPGKL
ncbi:two-component system, response regulator YesN [Evansella caseinilytica]|uniref:Two-component system, response regulator YesN n=1 Tax=Evansella caseinilytica TaxID=1503961 RepID=A0A1H3U3C3_9BACI|nr:response regulator [Evansella caseinilytica]SDZ56335.1 two-component system, response regulator YesN [Evansella caseinilytica]